MPFFAGPSGAEAEGRLMGWGRKMCQVGKKGARMREGGSYGGAHDRETGAGRVF